MSKGKMTAGEILLAVQRLLEVVESTGEKLTGAGISRRIGCGRTTLYTNPQLKELLIQNGIIENNPLPNIKVKLNDNEADEEKVQSLLEKRLQKSEERANRLEILLVESQEKVKLYEIEIEKLKLRNHLISQGMSTI